MKHILLAMFVPFGRASRVMYLAGYGLAVLAMPLVNQLLFTFLPRNSLNMPAMLPFSFLPMLWVIWCLMVNRLHDLNRTGAWAIIPLFLPVLAMGAMGGFSQTAIGWGQIVTLFVSPVLYMALGLLLVFFKGNPAPNRFGERPDLALS